MAKFCEKCGAKMEEESQFCPKCGASGAGSCKKSKLKIGCLGIVALFLLIGFVNSCGSDSKENSSQSNKTSSSSSAPEHKSKEKVYEDDDINVLIKEAKENAAAANQNYKKKNVKMTGKLQNIDSDVKYITLDGTDKNYSMIHVSCKIDSKNDALKESVLKLKKGQMVTIYGTIREVGDIMGYDLQLDKVEPAQ